MEHPFSKTFVVMTGSDGQGRRTLFHQSVRQIQKEIVQSLGLRLGTAATADYAVVPNGTVQTKHLRLPFVTWNDLLYAIEHTQKLPTEEKVRTDLGDEYDGAWSSIVQHVRKELGLKPHNLSHPVWDALKNPSWAEFIDDLSDTKWQVQRLLYRAERSWLLRVLEQIRMALKIWSSLIKVAVPETVVPLPSATTLSIHKHLMTHWSEEKNVVLDASHSTYAMTIFTDLQQLQRKVEWAVETRMVFLLNNWTDTVIQCFETRCTTLAPLINYQTRDSVVSKPLFLYVQELAMALVDRKRWDLLNRLREEHFDGWKEHQDMIKPAFVDLQKSSRNLFRYIRALQDHVREKLGVPPGTVFLWSLLPEMCIKLNIQADWKVISRLLSGSQIEGDDQALQQIGLTIKSKPFKDLLKEKLRWILRADA